MKRHPEDRDQFSLLKSLDDFARKKGLSITDPATRDQLVEVLGTSIQDNVDKASRLHGLHAQSMFAYMAAAMGACQLIGEEDSGALFDRDGDLQRPDFRIITRDGMQMLVEVKNFHPKNPVDKLRLNGGYLRSLKRYAELNTVPLKLAVYWSRWNIWTLLDTKRLDSTQETVSIDMPEAYMHNELHQLGDCMIGTEPPLSFRLYADRGKPRNVASDGMAGFTIARACLCAAGRDIVDPVERRIGWFLLQNGNWHETEEHAEINDDLVDFFELRFLPTPPPDDAPEDPELFRSIGFLSQMISSQYIRSTSRSGKLATLSPKKGPAEFGIVIPDDYRGEALKLWRFTMLPKHADVSGIETAPSQ